MKFIIDIEIFERFPGLKVGVVEGKNIDNRGESDEIMRLIREYCNGETKINILDEANREVEIKK